MTVRPVCPHFVHLCLATSMSGRYRDSFPSWVATSPHIPAMTGHPMETWVMVLFDVQPDWIGLDGRYTPKITKGGERKRGGGEGNGEGWGKAINKAGTHHLIKIYSPPPSPPSTLPGQKRGGENVISELLLPECLIAHAYVRTNISSKPMLWVYFFASFVCLSHVSLLRAKGGGVKNNLVICSAGSGTISCSCVPASLPLCLPVS